MKAKDIHSNIDSRLVYAPVIFAVSRSRAANKFAAFCGSDRRDISAGKFFRNKRTNAKQHNRNKRHQKVSVVSRRGEAFAMVSIAPLEAFHFSFLIPLGEKRTTLRVLFCETYIYANLDRSATFTLLNCRLSRMKEEKR